MPLVYFLTIITFPNTNSKTRIKISYTTPKKDSQVPGKENCLGTK